MNPKNSKPVHQSNNGPDQAGLLLEEVLHETVVLFGLGISDFLRLIYRHFIVMGLLLGALYFFSQWAVASAGHFYFLHWIDPKIFTVDRLNSLYRFPLWTHVSVIISTILIPVIVFLGFRLRLIRTFYQKKFESIGLINRVGQTPVLILKTKLKHDVSLWRRIRQEVSFTPKGAVKIVSIILGRFLKRRKLQLIFDSKNIPLSGFEEKRDALETAFDRSIEKISHWRGKRSVAITFSDKGLTDFVSYLELERELRLPEASFYIGQSNEGPVYQKIEDLPHMLIAGSTGAGKSVFFKQCLIGLLKSTPNLHLYIIDLKRGLEAVDFKKAPNVKIVKDIAGAVSLLRNVKREMENRFDYLEKEGFKNIVPSRDKRERIIVAVDESSVLHMKRDRFDPEYKSAMQARALIDSISKLARAAAINIVLATQKIDKETIPTTVQENISGRMAFKANTLQGSLVVLGNKEAQDLPEISGRGIWKFGNRQMIVQAPFIDAKVVQECCQKIQTEFKEGKRQLLTPMIQVDQEQTSKMNEQPVFDDEGGNNEE